MALDLNQVKKEINDAAERMGMDYEDLADMVPEVLDDCLEKAAKLDTAISGGDADQVKAIAHDLKGSTANYGIMAPSALAKSLEANFESPNAAELAEFTSLIQEMKAFDLT